MLSPKVGKLHAQLSRDIRPLTNDTCATVRIHSVAVAHSDLVLLLSVLVLAHLHQPVLTTKGSLHIA